MSDEWQWGAMQDQWRAIPLSAAAADSDEAGRRAVFSKVKAVVFDCDGVLWRGTEVIPGAIDTVAALEAAGIAVFFITNNSTRSRQMYTDKFAAKGFPAVAKDQILSASYAAAAYLAAAGFDQSVYVVGEAGIMAELEEAGIRAIGGPDQLALSMAELETHAIDPDVGAVVVGADTAFSYTKAAVAQQYLLGPERADTLFIATNPDTSFPTQGNFLPGAGMVVAAVEACASRKATVVGKPEPFLLNDVLARLRTTHPDIQPTNVLMVGDRLDTDILFGRAGGLLTLLVFSGVVSPTEYAAHEAAQAAHLPHYTADDVTVLADVLAAHLA